ncbi:MAG: hypothetical protein ACR2I8_02535 [Steroidobacteraceae bacterium]
MKESKRSRPPVRGAEGAALVARLQQRRERERAELSRMLHRDVAGMLAAVRMDLSRVAARADDPESQEQLRRVDLLLDQVIRDARREMQRLHPALLDHFGLPLALRHLIEETARERELRYNMQLDQAIEGVAPEMLIAAFRLTETLLGEGEGVAEFNARLAARRDGYVLELTRVATPGVTAPVGPDSSDLDALRAWLRSLGASWLESSHGERTVIELRMPRQVEAMTTDHSEAPVG